MAIDYEQAKALLNNSYEKAAQELPAAVTQYITDNKDALNTIFSSKTQSYREVLLGCAVARYQDRSCNIRHPYVKQGEDAFNGRESSQSVPVFKADPLFQRSLSGDFPQECYFH